MSQFLKGGEGVGFFYFCHYFLCHSYPRGGGVSPKLINVTHFTVFFIGGFPNANQKNDNRMLFWFGLDELLCLD